GVVVAAVALAGGLVVGGALARVGFGTSAADASIAGDRCGLWRRCAGRAGDDGASASHDGGLSRRAPPGPRQSKGMRSLPLGPYVPPHNRSGVSTSATTSRRSRSRRPLAGSRPTNELW